MRQETLGVPRRVSELLAREALDGAKTFKEP
jgi:hypothetical protein